RPAAVTSRGRATDAAAHQRVVGDTAYGDGAHELATFASMLRAGRRVARAGARAAPLSITADDLRARRRAGRSRQLALFVLDCSGSMGAHQRMATTKAAMRSLLASAYHKRDLVALIGFRGRTAPLLVAPTRDVARAMEQLRTLPTGGRTPLAEALRAAAEFVRRGAARRDYADTRVVLITDGRSTDADLHRGIAALRAQRAALAVIDTEASLVRLGRARSLARRLGATYVAFPG
ncbi:MAG: VWA domain-containing protein, partial [Chloroflexi bacterium]|nr:VWA domain-containing protein [Chloroflexota bacterium]